MNYYYLKNTDIVEKGDEWTCEWTDTCWIKCTTSIGSTYGEYRSKPHISKHYRIRRPITKTSKGNTIRS